MFVPTTEEIAVNYGTQRLPIYETYTDASYTDLKDANSLLKGSITNPYNLELSNVKETEFYQIRRVIDNTIYTQYKTLAEIESSNLTDFIWGKVCYGTLNNNIVCFISKDYDSSITTESLQVRGCIALMRESSFPELNSAFV